MRKTNKILLILFFALIMSIVPFKAVNAHTVELDKFISISQYNERFVGSRYDTIPVSIWEDYEEVYYQFIEIPEDNYSQIEKDIDEYKQLDDKVLQAASNGDDDKYDELIELRDEKAMELRKSVPMYDEDKWNNITNSVKNNSNTTELDLSQLSPEKIFGIWIKVRNSQGEYYNSALIERDRIEIESISFAEKEVSLEEGKTISLQVTVKPNSADAIIYFSSDNEKIAQIDEILGKVTAVSEGTATITAKTKDGEFTDTCTVTVTKKADDTATGATDDTTKQEPKADDTAKQETTENVVKQEVKDTTKATGKLPKTGASYVIELIVMSLIIASASIAIINIKRRK